MPAPVSQLWAYIGAADDISSFESAGRPPSVEVVAGACTLPCSSRSSVPAASTKPRVRRCCNTSSSRALADAADWLTTALAVTSPPTTLVLVPRTVALAASRRVARRDGAHVDPIPVQGADAPWLSCAGTAEFRLRRSVIICLYDTDASQDRIRCATRTTLKQHALPKCRSADLARSPHASSRRLTR